MFRVHYTYPWIERADKRTSKSIMVQYSRIPGTLVHWNQYNNSGLTIGRVAAGIEYSRSFRPKWSGNAGLIFQHVKDFCGSPLTASGETHDSTLLAKFESIYTGSRDHGSTMFAFNMEQGLPVLPDLLFFNRVKAHARKSIDIGSARLLLSLSGGHVVGNFSPHEAFAIGGTNSVRGYEEGGVGYGRSYAVGSGEISFPWRGPFEGVVFADFGICLGSGHTCPGRGGYGYGFGVRVYSPFGPLRLEYAFNDRRTGRFHFGVGHRY